MHRASGNVEKIEAGHVLPVMQRLGDTGRRSLLSCVRSEGEVVRVDKTWVIVVLVLYCLAAVFFFGYIHGIAGENKKVTVIDCIACVCWPIMIAVLMVGIAFAIGLQAGKDIKEGVQNEREKK